MSTLVDIPSGLEPQGSRSETTPGGWRTLALLTGAALGVWAVVAIRRRASSDTRVALAGSKGIHVRESVRIASRSPDEIYVMWRRLENLPRLLPHIEQVTVVDDRRSRWRMRGPAGMTAEWDAEIINDVPGRLIGWRSVGDGDVVHAGSVEFRPAGSGTELRLALQYSLPGGRPANLASTLFGEAPAAQVREDLRAFKASVERDAVNDSPAF